MPDFLQLTESMFASLTEAEFLGLIEILAEHTHIDIYKALSDLFSAAKDQVDGVRQYLFDAVYMVVLLQQYRPEIDLLGSFWDTYNINSVVLNVSPVISQAVKALNRYALSAGSYASIDSYLEAKNILVTKTWAKLSNESGYPISLSNVQ